MDGKVYYDLTYDSMTKGVDLLKLLRTHERQINEILGKSTANKAFPERLTATQLQQELEQYGITYSFNQWTRK